MAGLITAGLEAALEAMVIHADITPPPPNFWKCVEPSGPHDMGCSVVGCCTWVGLVCRVAPWPNPARRAGLACRVAPMDQLNAGSHPQITLHADWPHTALLAHGPGSLLTAGFEIPCVLSYTAANTSDISEETP